MKTNKKQKLKKLLKKWGIQESVQSLPLAQKEVVKIREVLKEVIPKEKLELIFTSLNNIWEMVGSSKKLTEKELLNLSEELSKIQDDYKNFTAELEIAKNKEIDTGELEGKLNKAIEDVRRDVFRMKQLGGGSMNQRIQVNGTTISKKYVDFNLKGSGVTLATADNDTTKQVDITITGTGGVTSVASADGSITVTNPNTTVDLAVVKAPILTTGRTISITGEVAYTSPSFDGSGNVTAAATLSNAAVIGKVLTGYTSGAGTVSATDTILQAIQKLNGNDGTNANLTGPITSVGNATSIASQTGTGTKFVMDTSPTIVTPVITQIVPGADFTLSQNSVLPFTSVNAGAIVNTLYLKAGNVGIGTTSPNRQLEIDGTLPSFRSVITTNATGNFYSAFEFGNTSSFTGDFTGEILSFGILANNYATSGDFTPNSAYFQYWADQNLLFVTRSTGGIKFLIGGVTSAAEALNISSAKVITMPHYGAGTATFDASGNISSVSDERLKDIQGEFSPSLNEILQINPILFKWKSETGLDTENVYAGFSAQNVMQVIPEAIGQGPDGFYSFNDRPVIAALVNAVKELSAQVDELRANAGLPTQDKSVDLVDTSRIIASSLIEPSESSNKLI